SGSAFAPRSCICAKFAASAEFFNSRRAIGCASRRAGPKTEPRAGRGLRIIATPPPVDSAARPDTPATLDDPRRSYRYRRHDLFALVRERRALSVLARAAARVRTHAARRPR